MRLKIGYGEMASMMAKNGINLFFQPQDRRTLRIGINSLLSIPIEIKVIGGSLNCKYSSGPISGRVINALLGLFRERFGGVRFDLSSPGIVGVELDSINGLRNVLEVLKISDIYFDGPTCIVEAGLRIR